MQKLKRQKSITTHIGAKTNFYPEIPKNLMFLNCEFCEKWVFENVIFFFEKWLFKYVNFEKNKTWKMRILWKKNEIFKTWISG